MTFPVYEIHGTCTEDEPRDSEKYFTYRGVANEFCMIYHEYVDVIAGVFEFGYFGSNEYFWTDRVI
jgi:hypothetical protein